jgi:hypothetical protein
MSKLPSFNEVNQDRQRAQERVEQGAKYHTLEARRIEQEYAHDHAGLGVSKLLAKVKQVLQSLFKPK